MLKYFIAIVMVAFFWILLVRPVFADCCRCYHPSFIYECACYDYQPPNEVCECQSPYQREVFTRDCKDVGKCKSPCQMVGKPEEFKQLLESEKEEKETPVVVPELQVKIPGFEGFSKEIQVCLEEGKSLEECTKGQRGYRIPWIGEYIIAIYKWAVGAIAIIAVVMIMIGGVQWMIAGGNISQISDAKSRITHALIAVFLILGTNLILGFINPNLTIFKPIIVGRIETIPLISQEGIGNEPVSYKKCTESLNDPEYMKGTNNVPLFKQCDPQWANHQFGICGTIKSSGCGPTSLAMILKFYGKDVNPQIVADQVVRAGYRICRKDPPPQPPKCQGCSGTAYAAFFGDKSIPKQYYGFERAEQITDKNIALSLLEQNIPLVAIMSKSIFTSQGHYIVLTGVDAATGDILVNDPFRKIPKARPDQVFCCAKAFFYIAPKK